MMSGVGIQQRSISSTNLKIVADKVLSLWDGIPLRRVKLALKVAITVGETEVSSAKNTITAERGMGFNLVPFFLDTFFCLDRISTLYTNDLESDFSVITFQIYTFQRIFWFEGIASIKKIILNEVE